MSCQVEVLRPAQYQEWDDFVRRHPCGTPFHLIAWMKTIEQGFGCYKPIYLTALEGGRITGVLPLFLVESLLIGKVLLSSPFAVYGGTLAETDAAKAAIRERVVSMAESMSVEHVELRNRYPDQALGFSPVSRYVTFVQEISPDQERILETIPRKTRYMVRKALKHPFSSRITTSLEAFEDLYSRSLRRLGTPCFPRAHFEALMENYSGSIDVREVTLEGKVVAAVMTLYFGDHAFPYYGASDPKYNEFAPNNFMYFDLMRWAGENAYRTYDFGRSKKVSGSFDFKAHWGMETIDLPYEMLLVRRKTLPDFTPNNPRLQWALKAWQRVPMPVARCIGPRLLRFVP
jgi:FemAB-related protein (PEP-CTERM system-associated)